MTSSPETILQFGAGRFLRAFVDRFVQHANDAGQAVGRVVVVQSTPGQRAELLSQSADGYQVLVRGYEAGEVVDRVERVRSIARALTASERWPEVLDVARSPDLRYVVTNSTEAGFVLDAGDRVDSSPPKSHPGKVTQVLWRRFEAKGSPLVLLPCELIERNGDKLLDLVESQAKQWGLPDIFCRWLRLDCLWLNSLVDCIVTHPPADHPLAKSDPLLLQAEPYALWAIEKPKGRQAPIFTDPAIQLVDDLEPYFLRKVRILNGLHTAMVCKYFPHKFQTVQQVVGDREAMDWIEGMLYEEILPAIAYRVEGIAKFAAQTLDRFRNPFTAHKLSDINLNHADKVRVRLEPTRAEYKKLFGKAPKRLSEILG